MVGISHNVNARDEQVINLRDVSYNHGITFETHVEMTVKVFSTPRKEKNKEKSEIVTVKENRALFARCAMLVNSERGVDMEYVISSFELWYPRSLMALSGDLYPDMQVIESLC